MELPVEVFLAYWWMGLFGGATAKRHLAISNSPAVRLSGIKSAVAYTSKSGKKSYKGTRFLKGTGSWA